MMVKYKFIIKALEQEISKSHLHLKIPSQVKKTMNKFREETRGKEIELGRIISDDGTILIKRKGGKKEVDWGIGGEKLQEGYEKNNYNPYHVEHNHPNPNQSPFPTWLSDGDLYGLFNYTGIKDNKLLMKSLTAEDSWNNSRMSLVLGDSWHKTPEDEWDEPMIAKRERATELNKELITICRDCYSKFHENRFNYLKEHIDMYAPLETEEEYNKYFQIRKMSYYKAMRDTGYFDEMKRLKKEYRKIDCRLTIEDMDDGIIPPNVKPESHINLLKAK